MSVLSIFFLHSSATTTAVAPVTDNWKTNLFTVIWRASGQDAQTDSPFNIILISYAKNIINSAEHMLLYDKTNKSKPLDEVG